MASLGRSSTLIAAGTMLSRVLGLVRSMLLILVLGDRAVSDAFQAANNLPNTVFTLVSAGLLTAVFVPQIVKAARHADGGNAFVSKLLTLSATLLLGVTAVATLASPLLIMLFNPGYAPEQMALAIGLAFWCMPQVLFYSLFAIVGETLNARNVYGPYTWAPIVNNVISILGLVAFMVMFNTPLTDVLIWDAPKIALLGITATGGIVAQLLVLLLFWRRTGLKVRPDFRWRGVGLGQVGRLAGWTFAMVLLTQLAGMVQAIVVSHASGDHSAGTILTNAWLVFMLPYSIIVMSIGTPYFTRITEHGTAGRHREMIADVDRAIRTIGIMVTLAAAVLVAAAVPASRIFTGSRDAAIEAAPVLWAYLVALLPMALLFIIQRTFYVFGDTRTPFMFTLLQAVIVAGSALLAAWLAPEEFRAAAVALGQSIGSIAQVILAVFLLRRRLGGIGARSWMPAYGRFILAGIPAGLAGWGALALMGGSHGWTVAAVAPGAGIAARLGGQLSGALGVMIVGVVAGIVYVLMLAILRSDELKFATQTLRRIARR